MDLGAAGLNEQPFPTHGKALATVDYASHKEALKVLDNIRKTANGLCLFQGPALSGKSTCIRQFVDSVSAEVEVAVVDGSGLNTTGLLEAVLRQFGYVLDHSSIRHGFYGNRLLYETIEQFAATSRGPPVEAKREFVEVVT